ncbi:MAG: hypothetical protein ACOYMS_02020 [Terrimicrobiaceae bacterium]
MKMRSLRPIAMITLATERILSSRSQNNIPASLEMTRNETPSLLKRTSNLFLLAAALFVPSTLHAGSAEKWTPSSQNSRQSLTYSASADLLGKSTPIIVVFGCDPTWDKTSAGTLGFDLTVKNASKLKAFPFADFEGPDAVAAPAVRLTLTRKGKPPLILKTVASGSYSEIDAFTFNVSEVSKKAKSVPRSLLQALAEDGADRLEISISDPRNPALALTLTLAVAGRQAEFKNLLTGLK